MRFDEIYFFRCECGHRNRFHSMRWRQSPSDWWKGKEKNEEKFSNEKNKTIKVKTILLHWKFATIKLPTNLTLTDASIFYTISDTLNARSKGKSQWKTKHVCDGKWMSLELHGNVTMSAHFLRSGFCRMAALCNCYLIPVSTFIHSLERYAVFPK